MAGTVGGSTWGIAKGVDLVAVRVLDCEGSGTTSGVIAGVDWVTANAQTPAVANMSLGGGQFTGASCDGDPRKPIIDNLRAAGIATVIAAGNESFTDAIGSPACISSAVAVGSTQDGSGGTVLDNVSPFSNSSNALDLLAPGQFIESSVPGGGFGILAGTSMAAPNVAGAAALATAALVEGYAFIVVGALAGAAAGALRDG